MLSTVTVRSLGKSFFLTKMAATPSLMFLFATKVIAAQGHGIDVGIALGAQSAVGPSAWSTHVDEPLQLSKPTLAGGEHRDEGVAARVHGDAAGAAVEWHAKRRLGKTRGPEERPPALRAQPPPRTMRRWTAWLGRWRSCRAWCRWSAQPWSRGSR